VLTIQRAKTAAFRSHTVDSAPPYARAAIGVKYSVISTSAAAKARGPMRVGGGRDALLATPPQKFKNEREP
jgi:hypothetical protein